MAACVHVCVHLCVCILCMHFTKVRGYADLRGDGDTAGAFFFEIQRAYFLFYFLHLLTAPELYSTHTTKVFKEFKFNVKTMAGHC